MFETKFKLIIEDYWHCSNKWEKGRLNYRYVFFKKKWWWFWWKEFHKSGCSWRTYDVAFEHGNMMLKQYVNPRIVTKKSLQLEIPEEVEKWLQE